MLSIDLKGPDGNAFSIMGRTRSVLRQLRVPQEEVEEYQQKCMSADYDNLLQTTKDILDKHHVRYKFEGEDDDDDDWDDDDWDEEEE